MKRIWSIRSYNGGDIEGIFKLMKSPVVKPSEKEKWINWWNWTYFNNPSGTSRIWLAIHDGKIIGHDALIPVKIKAGKDIVKGSQNIDLKVHQDYRRLGIFFALSKKMFKEAGKEKIHITYGFPNEQAYLGHLKHGWFDVYSLRVFIKPLNTENILKKYIVNKSLLKILTIIVNFIIKVLFKSRLSPKSDDITITMVSSFDKRINDFWRKVSADYNIIVTRNMEHLNWRYAKIPNVRYSIYVAEEKGQICGYIILKCMKTQDLTFGLIFDIFASLNNEEAINCLILKAIEYFREEKVDLIKSEMIANDTYYSAFKKNGFITSPFVKKGRRFIVRVNTSKLAKAYLKNKSNWFVQLGDSDFI